MDRPLTARRRFQKSPFPGFPKEICGDPVRTWALSATFLKTPELGHGPKIFERSAQSPVERRAIAGKKRSTSDPHPAFDRLIPLLKRELRERSINHADPTTKCAGSFGDVAASFQSVPLDSSGERR